MEILASIRNKGGFTLRELWSKGARLWVDKNISGDFDVADTRIAQFDLLAGSHTLDGNHE